ncbi:MAG: hypothetical protein E7213_06650 [Clostridium sp.]|nr:hypothetical protein [Clostridium sp.]
MNIDELDEILEKEKIPYSWYYIYGPQYTKEQKTCIEKRKDKWYVFYFERGIESDVKIFNTENDACEELYNRMKNDEIVFDRLKSNEKIK